MQSEQPPEVNALTRKGHGLEIMDAAVIRFGQLALEMGRYQSKNAADCPEFEQLLGRLEQCYDEMEDAHAERGLIDLLDSPDGYVRYYASKMLLLTNADVALPALQALQNEQEPQNLARVAAFTIGQWKNGFLFIYRRAKGRRWSAASP